jgi:plasmid stability protein
MKTTLDLPDDLMREVKIRAATQGKRLKDIVTELMRNGLRVDNSPTLVTDSASIIHYSPEGFPYIKCEPSTKPSVSQEELQRLIDESQLEEDLQRAGITL